MAVDGIPPLTLEEEELAQAAMKRCAAILLAHWRRHGEPATLAEKSRQAFTLVQKLYPPPFPVGATKEH